MEWKYEIISLLCRRRWTRKTIRDKRAGSTLGISLLLSFCSVHGLRSLFVFPSSYSSRNKAGYN